MSREDRQNHKIVVSRNPYLLAYEGARLFCRLANEAVASRGRFTVAVCPGDVARSIHRLLATEPFRSLIPWDAVHVFWVQEDMDAGKRNPGNFGLARADFLDRVPIPPANIHAMPTDRPPEVCAGLYEREITRHLLAKEDGSQAFDLIFLSLEEDGRVAAIFPDFVEEAGDPSRLVINTGKSGSGVASLTVTLPLLHQARQVVFIASGVGKARILKEVVESRNPKSPAALAASGCGGIIWLVDEEAASLLEQFRSVQGFK